MPLDDATPNERKLRLALAMFAKWIVTVGVQDRVRTAIEYGARGARDEEERGAFRLSMIALEAAEREASGERVA
jgi:hypothetical protein